MNSKHLIVVVTPLALFFSACPAPPPGPDAGAPPDVEEPDAGDEESDAGSPTDAGPEEPPPVDAGPGPDVTASVHTGAYLAGPVQDVLTSATTSLVIAGTQGAIVDPLAFDLPSIAVSAGLVVHDRATGETRVLTDADGLPSDAYFDPPAGVATVPVFDLEWIEEGVSFVAAAWTHVVRGTIADGEITFASSTVLASDNAEAFVTSVKHVNGELFVGTDRGVGVLDPSTLAVLRFVDVPLQGTVWTWALSSSDLGVTAIVSLENSEPSHVALVRPGESVAELFSLPVDEIPTALLGMSGVVLVGALTSEGGAIYTLDGVEVLPWASSAELIDDGGAPIVPNALAYDGVRERVLIGGQILAGSLSGGGLIVVDAAADGTRLSDARDLIERRDPYRAFVPPFVDVLTLDHDGALFLAGRQLCDETRLGMLPLVHVEEGERDVRVARPWVSGVRDIADDPASDATWLGLRDENPGLRCEGLVVAQSVCRLREDGSCEIFAPFRERRAAPLSGGGGRVADRVRRSDA